MLGLKKKNVLVLKRTVSIMRLTKMTIFNFKKFTFLSFLHKDFLQNYTECNLA